MTRTQFASFLTAAALAPLACLGAQPPLTPPAPVPETPDANGWVQLFDGKTLSGWTAPDPGDWQMKDGVLTGQGKVSHLFSPNMYTNLEFKAEVKLNHSGNSGMYIRARYGRNWPNGYETQVENTSPDPQRTGSLYNIKKNTKQLVQDDTWWTQHVIAIGDRIIIKVNNTIVVDCKDGKHASGYLALQQHNQGSVVEYRKVVVKRLSADPDAALAEAKKDMPDIGAEPLVK
jgi:hypothetical protein